MKATSRTDLISALMASTAALQTQLKVISVQMHTLMHVVKDLADIEAAEIEDSMPNDLADLLNKVFGGEANVTVIHRDTSDDIVPYSPCGATVPPTVVGEDAGLCDRPTGHKGKHHANTRQ